MEANYFTILWWVLLYIDINQPQVYMCPSPISNLFKASSWLQGQQCREPLGCSRPLPPHPLTLHAAHPRAVVNSQENRSSPGVHPRSLDLNIIAPILVKFHSDNNCSHAIYKVLNHTQEEFLWHWSSKSKTNIHVGNRAALVLECKSPQVWASEHLQREHLGFKSVSYADFWTPPSRDLRWVRISGGIMLRSCIFKHLPGESSA